MCPAHWANIGRVLPRDVHKFEKKNRRKNGSFLNINKFDVMAVLKEPSV